ncbi:hypothetical protein HBI80_199020 [Parastagonospora nodorum]|nr:hypothetical protein HBI10_200420 [Parastagonospora nodorum]KAH4012195.1 hypothetical protein HBI13_189730 [Parastagonospora nodorum]KAH4896993.1 hypothetical protein HBI80_199020 [Parastagonospora nodorum]KAH4979367.1 hypothetical protein HBI76_196500 [Parastagonospora nodorum]KAH5030141.1 hypothetical protein HBI74_096090 [Parastagonospora nodorum]
MAATDIARVRSLILPTLAYPSADRSATSWQDKMRSQPQIIHRGLIIIEKLHEIYNNVSASPGNTEFGIQLTTVPMTKLGEARIRAVMGCNLRTPHRGPKDFRSWFHENRRLVANGEFVVTPQAWTVKAGVARIGVILETKYRDIYQGLSHRDEFWRDEVDVCELNGFLWLGKKIEKWGEELMNRG